MKRRNPTPDMNGVDWQPTGKAMFEVVPAKVIGDMYYTYLDQYQEQLLDYYIEATDSQGNITRVDSTSKRRCRPLPSRSGENS
ncbi:hypothetical protein P4S72_12775 [Vibrio sp. PP-XX7]